MSVQEKQEYLREQILKADYDPLAFKDKLDSKMAGGGDDLELWSMEALRAVVAEFRDEQDRKREQAPALLPDPESPTRGEYE
jgi:hypothetical protein